MAGSRRSKTESSINYQEVDSDVDMDQGERVEARTAKAAKTKARNKSKSKTTQKAGSRSTEGQKSKPALSLDLIIALPLDIQAEICAHLEPRDLLNLCRTSRFWRDLLLSRRARAIWAAARRREKLPLLSEYNDIELAVLVFGRICWECAEQSGELNCFLRTRLCRKCRKQLVVAKSHAKSRVPSIHSRAPECCLTTRFAGDDQLYHLLPPPGWIRAPYCFIPELEATIAELFELDAEDEQAELEAMAFKRTKSSRTRTRQLGTEDAHERETHVEASVKEKALESARLYEESTKLAQALKDRQDEQALVREAERKRRQQVQKTDKEARKSELKALGWTDKETAVWASRSGFGEWRRKTPSASPQHDPDAWLQLQVEIAQVIAEEDDANAKELEERALRNWQGERQELTRPYYDRLVVGLKTKKEKLTFPRFDAFLALDTIGALWKSDYAFIDEDLWRCKQRIIEEQIEADADLEQVWIVCLLRAADRGRFVKPDVMLGDLRTMAFDESDDLPKSEHPAFFKRITSLLFFFERWWNGGRHSSNGIDIRGYPDVLDHEDSYGDEDAPLDIIEATGRRYTTVLKAILRAAELDEDTATIEQLDERGKTFRWLDYPVYEEDQELWEWRQLIREVVNRIKDRATLPYPTPNIVCDYVKKASREMTSVEQKDVGAEDDLELSSAEE